MDILIASDCLIPDSVIGNFPHLSTSDQVKRVHAKSQDVTGAQFSEILSRLRFAEKTRVTW